MYFVYSESRTNAITKPSLDKVLGLCHRMLYIESDCAGSKMMATVVEVIAV